MVDGWQWNSDRFCSIWDVDDNDDDDDDDDDDVEWIWCMGCR